MVDVAVDVGVAVGVAVGVVVNVVVGVIVALAVGVAVAVWVTVGVTVAVGSAASIAIAASTATPSPCTVNSVAATTTSPGVKVNVQLPPGGRVEQVLPVSTTVPSSGVPAKFDRIPVTVVLVKVFVSVRVPEAPPACRVRGEPLTVRPERFNSPRPASTAATLVT
jgi:hypothetical protein